MLKIHVAPIEENAIVLSESHIHCGSNIDTFCYCNHFVYFNQFYIFGRHALQEVCNKWIHRL